jgi:ribonuclease E
MHLLRLFNPAPMTSYIAIDASFQWIRTALVDGGILTDVYEESPEKGRLKGNIYKGVVRRVDPKINAAFVRYGQSRDGFLPLKDAERQGSDNSLKEGDAVLVQVLKDEVGEKGAALTTRLSLSGRALVYLLEKEGEGGVSSRLGDEDRSRLRHVLEELKIPDGASVILRTAALSKSVLDLQGDLDRLALLEKEIRDGFERRREPGLLWREAPPITRYLREYWQKFFDKVLVNTEDAYTECRTFFTQHEPEDVAKVELSAYGPTLFERLGLEETIARLDSPKVSLASGANIVIERTEALVSVDVNSSRSKTGEGGREPEEILFQINCEAAAEVARQIRLRDLGGVIVVDFIDMESAQHRQELESLMRTLCAKDKAKVKVYGLSPLGLMEINRQRLRKIPDTREASVCTHCQGLGRVEAQESLALKALRILAARLSERSGAAGGVLTVSVTVANKLWNEHRQDLEDLEGRYQTRVRLQVSDTPQQVPHFHWAVGPKVVPRQLKSVGLQLEPHSGPSKKPQVLSLEPQVKRPSSSTRQDKADIPSTGLPVVSKSDPDSAASDGKRHRSRRRGGIRIQKQRSGKIGVTGFVPEAGETSAKPKREGERSGKAHRGVVAPIPAPSVEQGEKGEGKSEKPFPDPTPRARHRRRNRRGRR